ncbi:SDR family oxidoreductase [Streptomyces sp. NPDC006670]|uniref:SDR family oxidoreductase n=1 Tax=Streptomyces sp. NPDC006670 TaxID=3154476 RepID=UPI003402F82F
MNHDQGKALAGKVALVTGASRGGARAIAVELGRAGATVYVTGRTTRGKASESGRAAETIEDTAELVTAAGGRGVPVVVDHLQAEQVRALAERIDQEQGRLDVLVNAVWGAEQLVERGKKLWDCDLDSGLRMLRLGIDAYYITSHCLLPLLIRRPGGLLVELTDGTAEFNNTHYRAPFAFDLAKSAPFRMTWALSEEIKEYGCTALGLAPGWMRTEAMLDAFHITEDNWRDGCTVDPTFAISETPLFTARAVSALATDPDVARFTGSSLSVGTLAKQYGFTDADGSAPDSVRYFQDYMSTGQAPHPDDYR